MHRGHLPRSFVGGGRGSMPCPGERGEEEVGPGHRGIAWFLGHWPKRVDENQ